MFLPGNKERRLLPTESRWEDPSMNDNRDPVEFLKELDPDGRMVEGAEDVMI